MSLLNFLFPKKLSVQGKNNIDYIRGILLDDIKKTTIQAEKFRVKLPKEVLMSVSYIQIFAEYLEAEKFKTVKQAWQFMNDIKGIIEKVFYVSNYIKRVKESMKESGESEDTLKPKTFVESPTAGFTPAVKNRLKKVEAKEIFDSAETLIL